MRSYRPDDVVETLKQIDLARLYGLGKRALLVDLDNTLAPWNDREVPENARTWVRKAKAIGFSVLILSNNHPPRIAPFVETLEVEARADAGKPWRRAFLQAAAQLGFEPRQCVMIGDQLMTDILGAKAAGMTAILVSPLDISREYWGTRINRVLEAILLWCMRVRRK